MAQSRLSSVQFLPPQLVERIDRSVSRAAACVEEDTFEEVTIDTRIRVRYNRARGEVEVLMGRPDVHTKSSEPVSIAFVRDGQLYLRSDGPLSDQSEDSDQQHSLDLVTGLG